MLNKIFIPLTLDNSSKHLFSPKQYIGTGFCVVAIFVLQLLCLHMGDSIDGLLGQWYVLVPLDLAGTYLIILAFRKLVLHENRLLKASAESKRLQKTDLSFMWDIFDIKDNKIYYCNGTVAVLVELEHGFLYNRPSNFTELHRDMCKLALGKLARKGFKFVYFNREVKDGNLKPLQVTERELYKVKDIPLYDVANAIIQHTKAACQLTASSEREYYLILADTADTITCLPQAATEFMHDLKDGLYMNLHLLSRQEILYFICSLYGIAYINVDHMLKTKFKDVSQSYLNVLDISRTSKEQSAQITEDDFVL